MGPRIKAVTHLGEYRLLLRFTDGQEGIVDLRERVVNRGGVFEALGDPWYFSRVTVDHESGTIVWPNGVDFCPDVLYSLATGTPISIPSAV